MIQSKNYVDPATGYYSQGIDQPSYDTKSCTKAALGYNHLLQYQLNELPWRKNVESSEEDTMTGF